jgi:hypothetical protein
MYICKYVCVYHIPIGESEVTIPTIGQRCPPIVTFTVLELGILAIDTVSVSPPEPGFSMPDNGVTERIFAPTYSKTRLCMCVCMYGYMHVDVYVQRNFTPTYSKMRLCMYVCMYVCMYGYMYVWRYVYVQKVFTVCMCVQGI